MTGRTFFGDYQVPADAPLAVPPDLAEGAAKIQVAGERVPAGSAMANMQIRHGHEADHPLEGHSDPSDESAVIALISEAEATKGTYTVAHAPRMAALDAEAVRRLGAGEKAFPEHDQPISVTSRGYEFRRTISIALCVAVFAACSKVSEKTVAERPRPTAQASRSYEQLEREARGAFLKDPRDVKTVEISVRRYREAIAIRADDYEALWEAARSCLWLGAYGPEAKRKDYVHQGLEYANTAVKLKPQGEEGLFYHGALAGRLAGLDVMYSADAIKIVEGRMLQLIENKSTFFYGGPDRVLAIVYMRAPGAPLGVGDYDKALTHMQRAVHVESHWLENQLYMAELEFRLGKKKDDPALTKRARGRLQGYFLKPGAKPPMAMGSGYEFKEWQKDARKLMEDYK